MTYGYCTCVRACVHLSIRCKKLYLSLELMIRSDVSFNPTVIMRFDQIPGSFMISSKDHFNIKRNTNILRSGETGTFMSPVTSHSVYPFVVKQWENIWGRRSNILIDDVAAPLPNVLKRRCEEWSH